jgi:hypothetical protein
MFFLFSVSQTNDSSLSPLRKKVFIVIFGSFKRGYLRGYRRYRMYLFQKFSQLFLVITLFPVKPSYRFS